MLEPNLDRFSRPLWREKAAQRPPVDELAAYKEQEDERRIVRPANENGGEEACTT